MFSLLQSIQKQVGKAASEIAAPSLRELPTAQLSEPSLGYLPSEDFEFELPAAKSFPCEGSDWTLKHWDFRFVQPSQKSVELPEISTVFECSLGMGAKTLDFNPDRWRLPAEAVGQHNLPLLGESDTADIQLKIKASVWPNRFRHLAKLPETTKNLSRKLGGSRQIQTEDCLAMLLARGVVSEDLHKPLARSARADGKRYADKTEMPSNVHGLEKLQTPPLAFAGAGLGNRKAFEQERGGGQRVTRGMSVWDLLFPLLQKPADSDLGVVVELPSDLYPYQIKGVEFLADNTAALLGDDMGTGKTVQTSVALRTLFQTGKIRTALIVCPLSVIPNWDRELVKWAGILAVTVVRGDKEHRKICWRQSAHVWLTTYDTLRNDLESVQTLRKGGFDLIALDEAQRVKNWSSGITRAVRELRATYRWGLSSVGLSALHRIAARRVSPSISVHQRRLAVHLIRLSPR